MTKQTKRLASAAVAGLFAGSMLAQAAKPAAPKTKAAALPVGLHCFGLNSCKGKSACKVGATCKAGGNSCKGKGFVFTKTAEECTAKKGSLEPPKT